MARLLALCRKMRIFFSDRTCNWDKICRAVIHKSNMPEHGTERGNTFTLTAINTSNKVLSIQVINGCCPGNLGFSFVSWIWVRFVLPFINKSVTSRLRTWKIPSLWNQSDETRARTPDDRDPMLRKQSFTRVLNPYCSYASVT